MGTNIQNIGFLSLVNVLIFACFAIIHQILLLLAPQGALVVVVFLDISKPSHSVQHIGLSVLTCSM